MYLFESKCLLGRIIAVHFMTVGVIVVKLMCSNQLMLTKKTLAVTTDTTFRQIRLLEYKTFDLRLRFSCKLCFLDLFPTNFIVTTYFVTFEQEIKI